MRNQKLQFDDQMNHLASGVNNNEIPIRNVIYN